MSASKAKSLKQIKSISRKARKTIRTQIDKQHDNNKEIIFLTKQLMKKISNEGTLNSEIGPTSGILDLVKTHLNEIDEYFNSKSHYKTVYGEEDRTFDIKMQKRRQTAKAKAEAKDAEELQKICNRSPNSKATRKNSSRKSKMSCSIQG